MTELYDPTGRKLRFIEQRTAKLSLYEDLTSSQPTTVLCSPQFLTHFPATNLKDYSHALHDLPPLTLARSSDSINHSHSESTEQISGGYLQG